NTMLANTLHKAIRAGRLRRPSSTKNEPATVEPSNKSERSQIDSQAPMGYATTRTVECMLAAVGKPGAPAAVEVERCCDVVGCVCSWSMFNHRKRGQCLPGGTSGASPHRQ